MKRSAFLFFKGLGLLFAILCGIGTAVLGWYDSADWMNIVTYSIAVTGLILWGWYHFSVRWIDSDLKQNIFTKFPKEEKEQTEEIEGIKVFAHKMEGLDSSALRETADQLRNKEKNSLIVLISIFEDKIPIVIARHKDLEKVDARKVMNHMVNLLGGSGGGRSDFSQGGIENVEDIDIALASLSEFLVSLNS